jgi:hypothetical protein
MQIQSILPRSHISQISDWTGAESVGHASDEPTRDIDSTNPPPTIDSTPGPTPATIATAPTSADTAKHLLSPTATRPRSSTVNSHTSAAGSAAGSGYESSSSEDSMLSFWSDDDSGDEESMTEPEDPTTSGPAFRKADAKEGKEEKKEEKKKREEDRSKVLEQAGLKLRREAPGIPVKNRRRAPDAPGKKRRAAPGLPPSRGADSKKTGERGGEERGDGDGEKEGQLDTLDAYARYENYLAQSQAQLNQPRPQPQPQPTSPQPTPGSLTPTRSGRAASIISQPSSTGGGRFSGLISRIMAPSTSSDSQVPRKSISIVRVDSDAGDDSGKEKGGGTWTSLVDPSVLGTMSDVERKRQEVSERGLEVRAFLISSSSYIIALILFLSLTLITSDYGALFWSYAGLS